MSKRTDPIIRKSISLPASTWGEVETYRDRAGVVTLADAIRRLLRVALRVEAEADRK